MKKYVLSALLISVTLPSLACDACGCSLGGNYFGILPQFNKNFVGLRWSQARFHASMNHDSDLLLPESSNDTYHKLELWGRFYITPKIQLFAFVPYSYNSMDGTEQTVSTRGVGDITISSNYLIFNTGEDRIRRFKHTLIAGAGVKLPTGDFKLEDNGALVNPNFQLGTGSVDFLFTSVYTLRFQKLGLNTESGYKINTRNNNDYLFGNQFHASSQVFFWQNAGAFSFLPNAGMYYEYGRTHRDGNIIQANTGGYSWIATAGLETYFRNLTLGFSYRHPLQQKYNSDTIAEITAKDRWSVAFTFNF